MAATIHKTIHLNLLHIGRQRRYGLCRRPGPLEFVPRTAPAAAIAQVGQWRSPPARTPAAQAAIRPTPAPRSNDRWRQPHLSNHIDAANRASLDARSMARRADRSFVRTELRPDLRRPLPRTPPRTIRPPVGAPPLVGGGVTGSDSFGLLVDGQSRPIRGFARSGGGPTSAPERR